MAPHGAELVVTRYTADASISETFKKIIKRAGLTPWPKLMQNLRATRETELIAEYPIKDVASWLGNSAPIAVKHYAMTMQSSFDRAIKQGVRRNHSETPQNPPHSTAKSGIQQQSDELADEEESEECQLWRAAGRHEEPVEMPRAGLEPAQPHLAGGF